MPAQLQEKTYWVYILKCINNSYYTGITTDLLRRFQEHQLGTSKCKYTRSFKPLSIAQSWRIPSNKSTALKIEKFIKALSRDEKEKLILNPDSLQKIFTYA